MTDNTMYDELAKKFLLNPGYLARGTMVEREWKEITRDANGARIKDRIGFQLQRTVDGQPLNYKAVDENGLKEEMSKFYELVKNRSITIIMPPEDKKEVIYDGCKWYNFIIATVHPVSYAHKLPKQPIDYHGYHIMGIMTTGIVYTFARCSNRDRFYQWLMGAICPTRILTSNECAKLKAELDAKIPPEKEEEKMVVEEVKKEAEEEKMAVEEEKKEEEKEEKEDDS